MNFNYKKIIESKKFRNLIIGIAFFLILIIVFQLGIFVGIKKAEFSERLGQNYGRIFDNNGQSPMMNNIFNGIPFDNLPGGHGAIGTVVKVSSSTLVVAEPNNIEKIVLIEDETLIRKFRENIKPSDIAVGDSVSVIGEANNDSKIEAKFIRVMPSLPIASSTLKIN